MEHLATLAIAFGLLSTGFLSPGPNVMAVIGTSMSQGRANGLALAAGIGCGTGVWAILAVTGMSQFITAYAWSLTVLKVFGVIYLLYLAYCAFKSAATPGAPVPTSQDHGSLRRYAMRGLTVQLSNPKAALYWVAIAAVVTAPATPVWVYACLVAGSAALSITAHSLYALGFSTQGAVRAFTRLRRPIQGAIGAFFTFAALRLATDR
ncbi:MAG: LysE family transporter [Pseudomonadota bacterium]